jgi:hypothetical protein
MRLERTPATTPDVVSQGALVQLFDMGNIALVSWQKEGWDESNKQSNQIENLSNQIRFDIRCHVCPPFDCNFTPNFLPRIHSAISHAYTFGQGNSEAGL